MSNIKRFDGTEWKEVAIDADSLRSSNSARPSNINTYAWKSPLGMNKGGYLEYVTAVKGGVTGNPSSDDGCLINLGWDNGAWSSQIFASQNEVTGCDVYTRCNTGTAGSWTDWKRLAFANADDLNTMINCLSVETSTPTDSDYLITQYVGGGTSTTTYHRRPFSTVWSYINSKASSVYVSKADAKNSHLLCVHPNSTSLMIRLAHYYWSGSNSYWADSMFFDVFSPGYRYNYITYIGRIDIGMAAYNTTSPQNYWARWVFLNKNIDPSILTAVAGEGTLDFFLRMPYSDNKLYVYFVGRGEVNNNHFILDGTTISTTDYNGYISGKTVKRGTLDSATKVFCATADGNGNNIVSTYATKTYVDSGDEQLNELVATVASDVTGCAKTAKDNTFSGANKFTGSLTVEGKTAIPLFSTTVGIETTRVSDTDGKTILDYENGSLILGNADGKYDVGLVGSNERPGYTSTATNTTSRLALLSDISKAAIGSFSKVSYGTVTNSSTASGGYEITGDTYGTIYMIRGIGKASGSFLAVDTLKTFSGNTGITAVTYSLAVTANQWISICVAVPAGKSWYLFGNSMAYVYAFKSLMKNS